MRLNVCFQRDRGRPVGGRGDEQAVRGGLVGAVDLAIVDLRQRIGAGRDVARIERVTGQAVELHGNHGRADDGHRHVVRRGIVEGADVEEREREHQHQRGHEHERDRLRRRCGVRHYTLSSAFSGRVSMWGVSDSHALGGRRGSHLDQTRI